jgi:hypothetical protein
MSNTTSEYLFIFEQSPLKRGLCPVCNTKDKFRYYQQLPREYGKCERKNECAHQNDPNKETPQRKQELRAMVNNISTKPLEQPTKQTVYVKPESATSILGFNSTNFHTFVNSKLGISLEHLMSWGVGGNNYGNTCFLIQNERQVLNVKTLTYTVNGKRDKTKNPYSLKVEPNTQRERCLFGLHKLSTDANKIVCLVESEKSAVIASAKYPDFDWLATGSASGLTATLVEPLYNRHIYYLCDADEAGRNNSTIKTLTQAKIKWELVDLHPELNDSSDIADYIINGELLDIKPSATPPPAVVSEVVERERKPKTKTVTPSATSSTKIVFYTIIIGYDKDGVETIKDVNIEHKEFINVLLTMGYRRYDLKNKTSILVRVKNRIVEQVSVQQIQDEFMQYLDNLNTNEVAPLVKKKIIEKFYRQVSSFFNEVKLSLLVDSSEQFIFNKDNASEAFVYYKNGYTKVDSQQWLLCDYSTLTGYIWSNQIIDREFTTLTVKTLVDSPPDFMQFTKNISGTLERFQSLCTIAGYNLHDFFSAKLKATVFTDSSLSDGANGRTGKTLFAQALGQIRNYTEINGKDFDPNDKYKYSKCTIETQILHNNDIKPNLNFDAFFNDITEGITVDKKNQQPFQLRVKYIISTNKTIRIDSASSRDRSIEFEMAEHYSDILSPVDEFKNRFFDEWTAEEFNRFDNFMMMCIQQYLQNGIIKPAEINLKQRKFRDETCPEFVEWITRQTIEPNTRYNRTEWHANFLNEYPDIYKDKHKGKVATFKNYLKIFALNTGKFKPLNETNFTHSGSNYFVVFYAK